MSSPRFVFSRLQACGWTLGRLARMPRPAVKLLVPVRSRVPVQDFRVSAWRVPILVLRAE